VYRSTLFANKVSNRLRQSWASQVNQKRLTYIAKEVAAHAKQVGEAKPVVIFNASARLTGLSQNAAFSLLTAWSLGLSGVPVVHFVCKSGMSHCVQGTNRQDYTTPPPCVGCIHQSEQIYRDADVRWFSFERDEALAVEVEKLDITALSDFVYPLSHNPTTKSYSQEGGGGGQLVPFGRLVLPSIRWALRCHHLPDDPPTRYLYRQYILSAYQLARKFCVLLDQVSPSLVLIFNGIMYPEAVAAWVARWCGTRVVTHEVGFQPFSAFFSHAEATAYPIHIPDGFALDEAQNACLDEYIKGRFKGKFSMAGIRFWPEMKGLDESFLQNASQFRQIVPVFTNVIYDTSQVHANIIFPHMFAWLDAILKIIQAHPETLFVIRAHPDEMRPGTRKQSRESVRDWVQRNQVSTLTNVVFVDSQEYLSSYELIQRGKFLMIYNSSIGLEAALMSIPVLCGGKARFTQYPTVFLPETVEEFNYTAEKFLRIEHIVLPPEFRENARKFLYYQLYKASLPFDKFLQSMPRPGFVALKPFSWQELFPEKSATLKTIQDGLLSGGNFLINDNHAV
jgi:hypothetical protein